MTVYIRDFVNTTNSADEYWIAHVNLVRKRCCLLSFLECHEKRHCNPGSQPINICYRIQLGIVDRWKLTIRH